MRVDDDSVAAPGSGGEQWLDRRHDADAPDNQPPVDPLFVNQVNFSRASRPLGDAGHTGPEPQIDPAGAMLGLVER